MRDADIRERLAAFGAAPDDDLSIAEAALWLAKRDLVNADVGNYLQHLREIGDDLGAACRGVERLRARVACLREVVFRHYRYQGDTENYDDPQNANLISVIDRRKGLPVALGILILHVARLQGWDMCGLNFPGHFLLRLSLAGESVILDPFERLRRLATEDLRALLVNVHGRAVPLRSEFIRKVSDRDVLLRLQNNIKSRALAVGDMARAFDVLDSMVLIAPDNAGLGDELAMLRAQLKGKLN